MQSITTKRMKRIKNSVNRLRSTLATTELDAMRVIKTSVLFALENLIIWVRLVKKHRNSRLLASVDSVAKRSKELVEI